MASVTRKAHSNRQQRRDEIRHRLLEVVVRLIEDGEHFTELSVERLVQEAGISRSTFYVYFTDKGDLLSAWFSEIAEAMWEASTPWWSLDGSSTRDELREALAALVHTYRPHTTLMAASFDAAAYDVSLRRLTNETIERNTATLRKHIRVGQKAGFIAPDVPAAETAAWLTWMAERALHQMIRVASDKEVERSIDAYTAIVWNTLYAPARA